MDRDEQQFQINDLELVRKLECIPGLDFGQGGHLVRRPVNAQRDDRAIRIHFEWACTDGIRYNLVAGPDVAVEFARTKAFYEVYPGLGVDPVALIPTEGGSVAVLKHFNGHSLEIALASGTISIEGAKALMDRLILCLDASTVTVTEDEFHAELDTMREEIHSCPVWGKVDLYFLDTVVFPYLRVAANSDYWRQRWTTGDFIARNILVNDSGAFRLIDYEFACRTTLAAADFQRFAEFSKVPEELREYIRCRLPGDARWWRIHFCLDQACKLASVRSFDSFSLHAPALLHRLWRDVHGAPGTPKISCLFGFLGDLDRLIRHTDSLQNLYNELVEHSTSLQHQYDLLLEHSNGLQRHYEALDKHTRNLQAAYDSLASSRMSPR